MRSLSNADASVERTARDSTIIPIPVRNIYGPAWRSCSRGIFPPKSIDKTAIKQRFLVVQALAAANAMLEGIVTDPREADVGSILGFGFAPFTGGTISYIEGMGLPQFVVLCDDLARTCGPRFAPPAGLIDMARTGERFYKDAPAAD